MRTAPAVLPVAAALGIVAEWSALHRPSFAAPATPDERWLAAADLVVGLALVTGGALYRWRRGESGIGPLLIVAGLTWFLGTFAAASFGWLAGIGAAFVTLHRGPLIHALVSYPTGRLRDGVDRLVVSGAYASTAIAAVGQTPGVAIGLACAVALTAARAYVRAVGPPRRARLPAVAGALAFAGVLGAAGAVAIADAGAGAERAVLWTYQLVVLAIAVVLPLDLLRRRWIEATVTDVVVELGAGGLLRDRLAAALGDRSLAIGYWTGEDGAFADERGGLLELRHGDATRQLTVVRDAGKPIVAVVHAAGALDEPRVAEALTAAVRVAVANGGLRREIARQVDEAEASRTRIVEAADLERRRLERALHEGARRRLDGVERSLEGAELDGADPATLADALAEAVAARNDLRDLGRGIHPRVLTEQGLGAALRELAQRASVPITIHGADEPAESAMDAAAYYVCSEGLANASKHASGASITIEVSRTLERLVLVVRDDGCGGATVDGGTGLRGLADRVEALGGRFAVASPPGGGTTVTAEFMTRPGATDESCR